MVKSGVGWGDKRAPWERGASGGREVTCSPLRKGLEKDVIVEETSKPWQQLGSARVKTTA